MDDSRQDEITREGYELFANEEHEIFLLKEQITDQINKLERIRLALGVPVGGQLLEERAEQLYKYAQAWHLLSDVIDKSCDPIIAANRLRVEIENLRAKKFEWREFDLKQPFNSSLCLIYGCYEGMDCDSGDDGRSISWRTGQCEFAKALARVYFDPYDGFDIDIIFGDEMVNDSTFVATHYINIPPDPVIR